ncbi:hypothetical protein, partial [Helicobacter pylori]|uniref:hypothetical protein n=1 Tax=Helicobacter pylori TaxID=210 RepID=UPI001E5621B3
GTTQLTIPNLEVKLFIADNTALFKSGNVGRCRDREMFFSLAFYLISLLTHCFVCLVGFIVYLKFLGILRK